MVARPPTAIDLCYLILQAFAHLHAVMGCQHTDVLLFSLLTQISKSSSLEWRRDLKDLPIEAAPSVQLSPSLPSGHRQSLGGFSDLVSWRHHIWCVCSA